MYRRLHDADPEDRSVSSTSNETDADEYHSLIDETYKKTSKRYEPGARRPSSGRIPSQNGNNCSRNRVFLFGIILLSFIMLIFLMNISESNEKGRVGSIAGWSANTSRQTMNYVLPGENTTLIDPLNICTVEERTGDGNENEKVFLLIVVCSSAKNFEARQVIRETWGNVSEFNYAQFSRMHAHLKGEYLEPRSVKHLREFIRWDNEDMSPEKTTTTTTAHRDSHASRSNKSSQSTATSGTAQSTPAASRPNLAGLNVNIKVVFLVGQSEVDYLQQRRKLPRTEQTAPTRPGVSLFPAGGDVDPAFNLREEELDELQMRLVNESEVYGDIIQESFIDSYNNLTLKTIMMLKWVTNNCDGRVKYIMKCDDDTFVNVPNLVHVLLGGTVPLYNATIPFYDLNTISVKSHKNQLAETKQLLIGYLFCDARPIADTSSKWYSPNYMYSKEFYPNYLSGTAYVMNIATVKRLYRASLTTPIFHLEDVYLTGIVADRLKLRRQYHPLFYYSYTKDLCSLRGMISQHQFPPSDLRNAYDFITNGTIGCSPPQRLLAADKMKLRQRKKCH